MNISLDSVFRAVDHLAGRWLDWRTDRFVAQDPDLMDLGLESAVVDETGMLITLSGGQQRGGPVSPAIAILADAAAEMLTANGAKNYVQFDMLSRLARGGRAVRVTVQWVSGKSPAEMVKELEQRVKELGQRLAALDHRLADCAASGCEQAEGILSDYL